MSRMRLTISALLLASAAAVAAPALAQDRPHGDGDRGDRSGAVQDGRGDGADHAGGRTREEQVPQPRAQQQPRAQVEQQRVQAAPQQARPQYQPRQDRAQAPGGAYRGDDGNRQQHQGDSRGDAGRHVEGRADNGVQMWRNNDRAQAQRPDWQNNGGDRDRRAQLNGNRDHGRNDGRSDGRQGGWDRNDHDRGGNWNNGWRNDRRYDWQGWRNGHRDTYRAGQYRVPYGYRGGYRRWGLGVRIDPIFFGQDYWIDNPGYYRLPPAYGDYRWVRYYNDALLIDTYSGTVIDEIPDFFW